MSAPDDSYRTAPTSELVDDLLDNRPEVYRRAKTELLARLANSKKEHVIELVAMEAEHSKPAKK
jgi:predicted Zn-dependent protease with MMP-like domain